MNVPKTILVVDDEIDLLEMIQFQLQSKGFKVVTAQDGQEALDRLKTLKPHLIVLDMNMPKMGGVEFYKKICDNYGAPRYPVFVLTARANMEQLFKDLQVEGFMPKPFEIEHLIREIETIVHKEASPGDKAQNAPASVVWKRKICLVENNIESFNRLAGTFLEAGYIVHSAKAGVAAVERIITDMPDVVLVNFGLIDMPGDMVIYKVKNMVKTAGMVFILYNTAGTERETILKNIGGTSGPLILAESDEPQELLNIANEECRKLNK